MSLVISRSFSYGRSPVSSQRRGGGSTQHCFHIIFAFLFSVAASRVVGKRKHRLKGHPLLVSLLSEEVESCPEDEREDTLTNDQEKDSRDRESNVGKP